MTIRDPMQVQLGPGMLCSGLDLTASGAAEAACALAADGVKDGARLLGFTLPGACFTIRPDLRCLEGDARPMDSGSAVIDSWTAVLSGTLTDCSPVTAAALLGSVTLEEKDGCTVLCPGPLTEELPEQTLCWLGETTRGLMGIQLDGAVSSGGLTFTLREKSAGELGFRFTVMTDGTEDDPRLRVVWREAE